MGRSLGFSLAVVAMATLVACGDSTPGQAGPVDEPPSTSSTPLSTTPPPTQPSPAQPPSTPSDPQPVDVVAGRVVRGGAGPCYGVQTDDGKLYAVHSASAGELAVGTTVLVKIGSAAADIYCGPGEPISASRIDVVG